MRFRKDDDAVALYPLSSPNHNHCWSFDWKCWLRYILFHHQTTTHLCRELKRARCVISSFITKPQLSKSRFMAGKCCVISSFITKPQPMAGRFPRLIVALYPLSSPNHNYFCRLEGYWWLRYILFHHQTTTLRGVTPLLFCCVISSFITKPQLQMSNLLILLRCVISSFITKPQHREKRAQISKVALYPLSSPNHNSANLDAWQANVALYPLSSPNHNCQACSAFDGSVALYPLSSPNHNFCSWWSCLYSLRYILFHHQTTTQMRPILLRLSCVISSFITKPQLSHFRMMTFCSCVISSFITKPQRCISLCS